MPLKVVTGLKGAGKTNFTTKLAYEGWQKGSEIWSNYRLNFDHKPLSLQLLMEHPERLSSSGGKGAYLLVDEITMWADSRRSGAEQSLVFTYLMLQGRKRHLTIIVTAQDEGLIDLRFRKHKDYLYECQALSFLGDGKTLVPSSVEQVEAHEVDRILVKIFNMAQNVTSGILYDPAPWFLLYDSDEFLTMPDFETKAERTRRMREEAKQAKK